MSDLISRQAAIDALDQIFDRCEEIEAHLPKGDPDRTGYKMYPDYMTVWKYLHQLPSAQPEKRWIPCSERLPEEGVNVLLCIKDWESQKTKIVVSLRRDYNYWDGLGRDIRGDIAWMPLPEAYKEGADE